MHLVIPYQWSRCDVLCGDERIAPGCSAGATSLRIYLLDFRRFRARLHVAACAVLSSLVSGEAWEKEVRVAMSQDAMHANSTYSRYVFVWCLAVYARELALHVHGHAVYVHAITSIHVA